MVDILTTEEGAVTMMVISRCTPTESQDGDHTMGGDTVDRRQTMTLFMTTVDGDSSNNEVDTVLKNC